VKCNFAKVETSCPNPCGPFELNDQALCFFDTVITTQVEAVGTPLEYWHQDVANSRHDPLYDEPIQRLFTGPWKLKGFVEWPEATAENREEGFRVTWDGTVTLARATLEGIGAPAPQEGDVIRFWPNAFFKKFATGGQNDPGAGYYFDVINVTDDGHVHDTAAFVGFKLRLRRRTEFAPERRLAEG
jgi:hypothetical protein